MMRALVVLPVPGGLQARTWHSKARLGPQRATGPAQARADWRTRTPRTAPRVACWTQTACGCPWRFRCTPLRPPGADGAAGRRLPKPHCGANQPAGTLTWVQQSQQQRVLDLPLLLVVSGQDAPVDTLMRVGHEHLRPVLLELVGHRLLLPLPPLCLQLLRAWPGLAATLELARRPLSTAAELVKALGPAQRRWLHVPLARPAAALPLVFTAQLPALACTHSATQAL